MALSSPIIIYQMGKVGSSSIYASLKNLGLSVPIYHLHFLSQKSIQDVRDYYLGLPHVPVPAHVESSKKLQTEISLSNGKVRWKVITLVRDPVARDISDLFQNMDRELPHVKKISQEAALNDLSCNILNTFQNFNESSDYACTWFDKEIKEVFNFDIYSVDFNKSVGYQIYEAEHADILVLKLEKLKKCHKKAFKEFLDIENFPLLDANLGNEKKYHSLYTSLLETINIPASDLKKIYSSRYSKYFTTKTNLLNSKLSGQAMTILLAKATT